MCAAARLLVDATEIDYGLLVTRVVMSASSLHARHLKRHLARGKLFEPVARERFGGPATTRRFRAQVLVHGALTCLVVVVAG